MITPCIILTKEQAEWHGFIFGEEILPGIVIAPYRTERQAKADAKEIGGTFARIDYEKVFL